MCPLLKDQSLDCVSMNCCAPELARVAVGNGMDVLVVSEYCVARASAEVSIGPPAAWARYGL